MKRRLLLGLMSAAAVAALLPPLPALAAREAARDAEVMAGMVRTHILPRLDALVAATAQSAERLERFAAAPSPAGLEACREAHGAVWDAWEGVQHLRPGPLMAGLRADRFSFWPERPGVVQRQIGTLLHNRDPKLLEPGALGRQSAAVQGLTVLERLLFDEGVTAADFDGDDARRYRGALAAAAGRNLAAIAAELRADWAAMEAPLAANRQTALGPDATWALNALFTAAITQVQVITDQKLLAPLGADLASAKPAVAEALRSGRSVRNIALNLQALRGLMLGENGGPGYTALLPGTPDGSNAREAIDAALADALMAVEAIPGPLPQAVADAGRRKAVERALRAVKGVRAEIVVTMAPLLDITLGFNELDGD
ncbi:hypothetical protein DEW08_25090 (plasmid) [Azospirillum thermophilum]|uniref:Imelysin-like domain-containing protein n=2 Tax=Azospirillum thermophilum TaxID=2202148 RepID=A0A2S2CZ51_9PROT|nr:hypothetical protein DEW08_25090 [Azospirillum thermophilum]